MDRTDGEEERHESGANCHDKYAGRDGEDMYGGRGEEAPPSFGPLPLLPFGPLSDPTGAQTRREALCGGINHMQL